jgi:hypothetical protein
MNLETTLEGSGESYNSAMIDIENKINQINNLLAEKHIRKLPNLPESELYTIEYTGGTEFNQINGYALGKTYHEANNRMFQFIDDNEGNYDITNIHVRFTYKINKRQSKVIDTLYHPKKPKGAPASPFENTNNNYLSSKLVDKIK